METCGIEGLFGKIHFSQLVTAESQRLDTNWVSPSFN